MSRIEKPLNCTECGKIDIYGDDLGFTPSGCLCLECRTKEYEDDRPKNIVLFASMNDFPEDHAHCGCEDYPCCGH